MTRIPSTWQSLLRLPLLRRSLSRSRSLPAIGASGVLMVGLGTLAVTLDATPEQVGPRWHGRIDGGVPVAEARAARLLGATAIGLETELRGAGTGHVGRVRALDAELCRLRDAQADLAKQQAGLESRLAAAIELASVKGGAFDLVAAAGRGGVRTAVRARLGPVRGSRGASRQCLPRS